MGRLTPTEFRKKYAELPENLREAYGSIKTTEILEEIGKKHGLLIDQIGELVDETGYLMLGATQPGDYIGKLAAAVGVERGKAKEIAVEVNERVFKPIRDALKQVHKVGNYEHLDTNTRMKTNDTNKKEELLPISSVQSPASSFKPPESSPQLKNLSEERLTKTFSLPSQEKSYSVSETGDEETPPSHRYQIDPYREPTD